jgi:outer membrane usher protein
MGCAAGPCSARADPDLTESVLEVTLKSDGVGDTMVVLRGPGGILYLEDADFAKLRLRLPSTAPYDYEGHHYYAPTALKGCTISIDEVHQRAIISAPSWALDTTRLSAAERRHTSVTPAAPGAFFNYQLSAQQIERTSSGGIYGELGLFAGPGVITNTQVARDGGGVDRYIRLDTTFTRDFPDQLETLNVGDSISDPGSWGYAEHFAGVRFSRNFALRPDLLTTPLLTTSGSATVPSTVDVFVNNQLVASNQVPSGPFIIDKLPAVTGTDNVEVVVRDATGREEVVSQTFYSSSTLLAPNLSQYSLDFGSVRDDYGLASDRYGSLLGEASYRRGINSILTLEAHGEYQAGEAHAAGLNAVVGLGHVGIVNFTIANGGGPATPAVAASTTTIGSDASPGGSGWLEGVGLEHRGPRFSFVANSSRASSGFAQVGEPIDAAMRIRQRSLVQSGVAMGRFGSLSVAYVAQSYHSSPTQQTLGVTHTLSFGRVGALNLTLSRTRTAADAASTAQVSTSAYLVFVHSLGGRRTVSVTQVEASGSGAPDDELMGSFAESAPAGTGSGYRVSASTAGNYDADLRQQAAFGDFEVEAARNQGVSGQSALVTGAVTWLDGAFATTRSVNGSFAMVDVGGIADVPVYVENQLIAHTDSSGKALLYNLRPYEPNHISIEPAELPLDTTIAATSTVMAPPFRSGVVAMFPVERVRGATLRLVTADGKPVPTGSVVHLHGNEFPVVEDGMVYVTGYAADQSARVTGAAACQFRLPSPPDQDPLPDLGTIRCAASAASTP